MLEEVLGATVPLRWRATGERWDKRCKERSVLLKENLDRPLSPRGAACCAGRGEEAVAEGGVTESMGQCGQQFCPLGSPEGPWPATLVPRWACWSGLLRHKHVSIKQYVLVKGQCPSWEPWLRASRGGFVFMFFPLDPVISSLGIQPKKESKRQTAAQTFIEVLLLL